MRADDPNVQALRIVADALGPLVDQLVFIGGAVAGLLITDPLAEAVRSTQDVDAIAQEARARFHQVEKEVASRGFRRDPDSAVICRWVHCESGIVFDLMPVDPAVFGFLNRWYRYAAETAEVQDLGDGLLIRRATAVAFVATKLEAFAARGAGDVLGSHDLEDVLNIVDGRQELAGELARAPADVRETVAMAFKRLLADADFGNALPGMLADPSRSQIVLERMRSIAELA